MREVEFADGVAVNGEFPSREVLEAIERHARGKLPLVVADPPYGNIVCEAWDRVGDDDRQFAGWMFDWTRKLETLMVPGAALYVWGGIGRPRFRPFYRYLSDVERETAFSLANHITWKKRRAYGVAHNYLFVREELAYLVLGPDPRKPRKFAIPLLEQKRGYTGYDKRYPAKSEYLRRTNIWTDVTEILQGKVHAAQKPERLSEIPIEVHTEPGETVLDPFAGSGTTARAARRLGRRFIVVERDPAVFDQMVEALSTQKGDQ